MVAAGVATWVALLGATLWQANDDRAERGRAQEPRPAVGAHHSFEAFQTDTPYDGDVWTTIHVGALQDGADPATVTPPGVPAFLAPGTTYVSPAVRRAMARDPLAVGRVPGRIIGTIAESGLQSPDQLLVYSAGTPGPLWRRATGWGSPVVEVPRGSIPSGPLLGLVALLVGVPSILLARATSRMSAVSRQRSLAASHLIGVPIRTLATAAALDASLCAVTGFVGGSAVAIASVLAVHRTRLLGIEWFPPASVVSPPVALMVGLVLIGLISREAARSTRRDLQTPLSARAGGPRPTRPRRIVPMLLGVAGLAGMVFAYVVLGVHLRNGPAIVYFYAGGALATLGAFSAMPVVLQLWSRRPRRREPRSTESFLAVRRLSWQRDALAAACIGFTVVGLCCLVGAAALADLDNLSVPSAAGDEWDVQVAHDTDLAPTLAVPHAPRMLDVSGAAEGAEGVHHTLVADCSTLARIIELTSPGLGDRFTRQCHPGRTFRVASHGAPNVTRVVLPGGADSILGHSDVVAADPTGVTLPAGQRDILVFPGATDAQVDAYVSRVMAVAPEVQVSDLEADAFAPMVTPTRRLMLGCTIGGMLTAGALLVLCALDQRRLSRMDDARLVALGATRRLTARAHAETFARAAAVALGVGLLVGGLDGTVYDRVGGLAAGPGGTGVILALVAVAVATAAVVLTWLMALPEHRGALGEELRRE
ncbi:hypothetical protein GCM10009798_36640 [Nocardioides panacihumi]|uniref:FtsX-like permease family protein n=2 Tax=Nocardioides panacihumi TaxID=400774 RepID=A0ABN2RNF8_9ACTN